MNKISEEQKKGFLEELLEFLKFPSISADSNYKDDLNKTAVWVSKSLIEAGCDSSEVIKTKGHPIVYGEKIINKEYPTVLVYGHYDVQPPDPLNLWKSPPFEPVIEKTEIHPDGAIFARGACDDKGQVYMHIKAFQLMVENQNLNCNVKFMIEGEEEVGSNNLEEFIKNNKEKLNADIILISDTGLSNISSPTLTVGLRGLSYMEIKVIGPNRDLHSGTYGGTIYNPANALAKIITSLIDDNGKITIPGFYDDVINIDKSKREEIENKSNFNVESFKKSLGIDDVKGEEGYTTLERKSIRPTLDVNGIWGGYTGEGSKTVIASEASAKISMRLVPNQDWNKISDLFTEYIESIIPDSISVEIIKHHGGSPYVTPEY